jgi:hypothetical protein
VGELQLLGPNDAIAPNDAIVLDSNRGLVGSPQPGEKGIVEARSLLNPHLIPGRVVSLSSRQATGFYRQPDSTELKRQRSLAIPEARTGTLTWS